MKSVARITSIMFLALLFSLPQSAGAASAADEQLVLSIESVFCSAGDCKKNLEDAVLSIEGVDTVELKVKEHRFEIQFDAETTTPEEIREMAAEATGLELVIIDQPEEG